MVEEIEALRFLAFHIETIRKVTLVGVPHTKSVRRANAECCELLEIVSEWYNGLDAKFNLVHEYRDGLIVPVKRK